jgi:hypothetical protein
MITEFDLYWFEASYEDGTGSKKRPIIIVDVDDTNLVVELVGVYSYRKWFRKDTRFFELLDWRDAGLLKKSYAKLSNFYEINSELINTEEYIGSLSDRDRLNLIEAIEEYYEV